MNKSIILIISFLLFSSCASLDQNIINAIAGCSGGFSEEFVSKIKADLQKTNGEINASIYSSLQGTFLNNPSFSGEQALLAHKQYLECYTNQIPTEKSKYERLVEEEKTSCEVSLECEKIKHEGLRICRETVDEFAEESGISASERNRIYKERCLIPFNKEIRNCWGENSGDTDLDLLRSQCEVILDRN